MILINSSPKNALKIFQPFLPISVPIGIGILAAVGKQKGINVKIIDEQVEDNVLKKTQDNLKDLERPYIFGFSVLTAAVKNAIELSKQLKSLYPDSIIIFGGIHPTALPEEILSYPHIDFVMRGECEESLFEFYSHIKEEKNCNNIKNLSYRANNKIIHNPREYILENLDDFPLFPYHLFTSPRYDLGFLISSRGCPYECIFCSNRVITGKRYRYRSAKFIADELDILFNKYKKTYVSFLDDNFLVIKKRIYELIKEIKMRGLDKKMTFNFQARGDNVNPEILKSLYNSGFRNIFFGMETASERLMQTIQKGETVKQIVEGVKMAKSAGFSICATFIYGLPGETHQDRMACPKIVRELGIHMVRYNNATPYPGTKLYEIAKKENRLFIQGNYENFNSVSTFIESPFKPIPLTYVPKGTTEKELRDDILWSYLLTYLNIGKLKTIFQKPDRSSGWFNAGESINALLKKIPAILLLTVLLSIKFTLLIINRITKSVKHLRILRRLPLAFRTFFGFKSD